MDASVDVWFILLSVVFTTLAGFLTAVLFGREKSVSVQTDTSPAQECPPCKELEKSTKSSKEALAGLREPRAEPECTAQTTEELQGVPCGSNQQEIIGDRCEKAEAENEEASHCPSVKRMGDEGHALRYMPGMLRTSQLEKMISKEELDEEQRVQREQLAAIFKLLKENQDTFGEVTEKDMEEQLKLYSI